MKSSKKDVLIETLQFVFPNHEYDVADSEDYNRATGLINEIENSYWTESQFEAVIKTFRRIFSKSNWKPADFFNIYKELGFSDVSMESPADNDNIRRLVSLIPNNCEFIHYYNVKNKKVQDTMKRCGSAFYLLKRDVIDNYGGFITTEYKNTVRFASLNEASYKLYENNIEIIKKEIVSKEQVKIDLPKLVEPMIKKPIYDEKYSNIPEISYSNNR